MRGGKRPGAGRRLRLGTYHKTTPVRVPAPLKQDIVAYIERLCANNQSREDKMVAKSKSKGVTAASQTDKVTFSKDDLNAVRALLNEALHLKANAGGAIKHEIRKVLRILQL